MWNLVRNEQNDILLVSSQLLNENLMSIVVIKNYECMFTEEIKPSDINARFQLLNEGIEIEEDILTKSIVDAMNDGSTSFKDIIDSTGDRLELQIKFDISNIQLKWSNNCKLVDLKKICELFTQPLLSYTSLLMLHNKILLSALKEKDSIIDQYKDIQIPTVKKMKKSTKKNPENIELVLNSKEFEESLFSECSGVFSKDACNLMENIANKHHLPTYFNKPSRSNDEEKKNDETDTNDAIKTANKDINSSDKNENNNINNNKDDDSNNEDGNKNDNIESANNINDDIKSANGNTSDEKSEKKSLSIAVKRKGKEDQTFEDKRLTEEKNNELELKKRNVQQKKLADEKKRKIKKLKF